MVALYIGLDLYFVILQKGFDQNLTLAWLEDYSTEIIFWLVVYLGDAWLEDYSTWLVFWLVVYLGDVVRLWNPLGDAIRLWYPLGDVVRPRLVEVCITIMVM